MAEGRGKAQAASLRKARRDLQAKRLSRPDRDARVRRSSRPPSSAQGRRRAGRGRRLHPGRRRGRRGRRLGRTRRAITGESAPVIRESGGDRSSVTGGTQVLSDWLIVEVTANPGEAFLDRMIALVEGAKRQKTPNEIALDILLAALTIIFLLATATLLPFSLYSVAAAGPGHAGHGHRAGRPAGLPDPDHHRRAAVGHRHRRHGPHDPGERHRHVGPRRRGGRRRGRAAARQDRHDHAGQPPGRRSSSRRRASTRARRWPTRPSSPRSPTRRRRAAASWSWPRRSTGSASATIEKLGATFVPFTAQTRMSGVEPERPPGPQGRRRRHRGATSSELGGAVPAEVRSAVDTIAKAGAHAAGGRPTAPRVLGRHPAQGHRQGRHPGALRRAAPHGHQDRHDHRRQPADRGRHRRRGGRGRLPRPGHARGQAEADPRHPGARAGWSR